MHIKGVVVKISPAAVRSGVTLYNESAMTRPSLDECSAAVIAKATHDERIHEAVMVHCYTLRELGNHVGLLYSTISVIASGWTRRNGNPKNEGLT